MQYTVGQSYKALLDDNVIHTFEIIDIGNESNVGMYAVEFDEGYRQWAIEYLNSVVKHHGVLHRNRRGRYESASKEYTCGSSIEAFVYDHAAGCSRWVKTRVEHNGMDYYLVRWPDVPMQGLKVRER